MILLTAFVVMAGISGVLEDGVDEQGIFLPAPFSQRRRLWFFHFPGLIHHVLFLEVAVIPKFLLIGIWGSGKKGIQRHEAGPHADGRIGPDLRWIAGVLC
jgi:NADH-quinone oxidoreductase subunit M